MFIQYAVYSIYRASELHYRRIPYTDMHKSSLFSLFCRAMPWCLPMPDILCHLRHSISPPRSLTACIKCNFKIIFLTKTSRACDRETKPSLPRGVSSLTVSILYNLVESLHHPSPSPVFPCCDSIKRYQHKQKLSSSGKEEKHFTPQLYQAIDLPPVPKSTPPQPLSVAVPPPGRAARQSLIAVRRSTTLQTRLPSTGFFFPKNSQTLLQ